MKKNFLLLLVLVLLCAVLPAAAVDSDYLIFSNCGSTEGVEDLFRGDTFFLTLYMHPSTLKAFIVETTIDNGIINTVTLRADVKSKKSDNMLYFVLENGHTVKGHYDQNECDFWLDFDSGSVKLEYVDQFVAYYDFIGGKYADESP